NRQKNYFEPQQIYGFKGKYISCGNHFSAIIDLHDNIHFFGSTDSKHILPTKKENFKCRQVEFGFDYSIMLDIDQNVWMGGRPYSNDIFLIKLGNIKSINFSCGIDHVIIMDMNHNLWASGNNGDGQLGLGAGYAVVLHPIQIGSDDFRAYRMACGDNHT